MKYIKIALILFGFNLTAYPLSIPKPTQQPVQNNIENKVIKLYVYEHCGYCHKVINFLKEKGWLDRVVIVDADDYKNYKELKKARGDKKDYCPFLVDEINDKKLSDSSEIIKYFTKIFSCFCDQSCNG